MAEEELIANLSAQCLKFHHRAPMRVCPEAVDEFGREWCVICRGVQEIDRLLSSLKELRDALAGAMRSMDDGSVDRFVAEMTRMGIPDGVGVRADRIVKELSDDG